MHGFGQLAEELTAGPAIFRVPRADEVGLRLIQILGHERIDCKKK